MTQEADASEAEPKSFDPVPVCEQLRKNCIGRRLELMFNVGWCPGEIRSLLGPNRYKVLFDGESNVRECRLPLSTYAVDDDSPISSWRLYTSAPGESSDLAQEGSSQGGGAASSASRSLKRAKVHWPV